MATIIESGGPAAPVQSWQITQLALKRRWPRAKWTAMRVAAATDAALSDFVQSFEIARFIDLKDAETIAGVQAMMGQGVDVSMRLTQQEADAILTVPASESERA